MIAWLEREWQYAGAVAAAFLVALLPLWIDVVEPALVIVYLQLPLYLVHQVEEHHRDRFRHSINATIGGGREVLSRRAVLWTNLLGVWALQVAAIDLAAFVDLSFGLIAIYLPLVNGVAHVVAGIALRAYNPGLVTAVVLFLGAGSASLVAVSAASGADAGAHAIGLGTALAAHAVLIVHVARRRRSMLRR